jgi:hypothetical protein
MQQSNRSSRDARVTGVAAMTALLCACTSSPTAIPTDTTGDDAAIKDSTIASGGDTAVNDTAPTPDASGRDTAPSPDTSGPDAVPTLDAADAPTPPSGTSLRFLVFGDSRDNPDVHQTLLDSMSKMNPQLIVDTGDLWAGYPSTSRTWATITTSNANIAALLNANLYLVSRGNHESLSELLAFSPPLVRNKSELYSVTMGNAFFVSVGMDPSKATTFLKKELSSPAATAATWRFVYSHFPIYDSGDGHGPVTGIRSVESLCDTYHVTAFFSGHEHIYERFNQISGGSVVDTGDSMKASKGTVYLVSGGAGAPFYSVTSPLSQSHVTKTDVNHYSMIDLTATTMTVQVLDSANAVIDQFKIDQ